MATVTAAHRGASKPNRKFAIMAVGCGLLAAVLVFAAIQSASGGDGGTTIRTVPVVVAATDIPASTRITPLMVKVDAIPADVALDRAIRDDELVIGQIARYPIAAKEQITTQKVGAAISSTRDVSAVGLPYVIPPGMRAVAIEVNEQSAVGGLIVAGDRVDIIALLDPDFTNGEKASTILQNQEVLSVAQVAQNPVPPAVEATATATAQADFASDGRGLRPTDPQPQPGARTVTLAVSPADAQLLVWAQAHGELYLTLRPEGDGETVSVSTEDGIRAGALPPAQRR